MYPLINPPNRVLQLDGKLLDNEIFSSLSQRIHAAFGSSSLPVKVQRFATDHADELDLALKLALFKVTVWDKSTTYGLALQNLRLTDGTGSTVSKLRRLLLLVTILTRYLYGKFESLAYRDEPVATKLIPNLQKVYSVLNLANFVAFLVRGRYSTLTNRLLGLTYAPLSNRQVSIASNPETISYEFQDRQLVWNTLTEFLAFTLPMISMPNLVRNLKRLLRIRPKSSDDTGMLKFLPECCCPICYQTAQNKSPNVSVEDNLVTNPYITSCGHIYCYYCISNKLDEYYEYNHTNRAPSYDGSQWLCLRCAKPVAYCRPYDGEIS